MSAQLSHYYRKRQELIEYLGGKCVDCGSVSDLEFDHNDRKQKRFDIGANYGLTFEKLKPELDKCSLRCAPCHEKKTRDVDGLKMEHGKYSMYRHAKCRCTLCTEANRLQHKAWRDKKLTKH